MTRRVRILGGGALALLMLAGCQDVTGDANAQTTGSDLESWVGSKLDEHATVIAADQCLGGIDLEEPAPDDASKTVVTGWAWDVAAAAAPQAILLVDFEDAIAAQVQPGLERSDVTAAMPEVTSEETGWSVTVDGASDQVTPYALLATGEACPLGRAE